MKSRIFNFMVLSVFLISCKIYKHDITGTYTTSEFEFYKKLVLKDSNRFSLISRHGIGINDTLNGQYQRNKCKVKLFPVEKEFLIELSSPTATKFVVKLFNENGQKLILNDVKRKDNDEIKYISFDSNGEIYFARDSIPDMIMFFASELSYKYEVINLKDLDLSKSLIRLELETQKFRKEDEMWKVISDSKIRSKGKVILIKESD